LKPFHPAPATTNVSPVEAEIAEGSSIASENSTGSHSLSTEQAPPKLPTVSISVGTPSGDIELPKPTESKSMKDYSATAKAKKQNE
jgi:hypothetical protein